MARVLVLRSDSYCPARDSEQGFSSRSTSKSSDVELQKIEELKPVEESIISSPFQPVVTKVLACAVITLFATYEVALRDW